MSEERKSDESECKPDESATEGRVTLLGSSRRRLIAVAAVVVIAAAVTLVVIVSTAGRSAPSGAIPTLDNQFAGVPATSAAPPPAASPELPRYSGKPQWTLALPDNSSSSKFAVTDHGYVLQENDKVLALNATGAEVWRFTPPAVDYFAVRVTGPVVFVGYKNPGEDRWPQPQMVIALDAATGAELWRDGEASLWSATTDTVYMSVCYGGQNNRIGDCELTARDPRTNAIRWSVDTYASSRVENQDGLQAEATPSYLLVGSYPASGGTYYVSSHDPATGRTLGGGYAGPDGDADSPRGVTEQTLIMTRGYDENPADGCTAALTGFGVSGPNPTWQYTAHTAKEHNGELCGRQPGSINRGRMGVTTESGMPAVLNLETGAIEWTAPAKSDAIAASGTTLLAVESKPDGKAELVAYQVGNAKPVWRAPFLGEADGARVIITDTVVYLFLGGVTGYDLKSGKAWTYGGELKASTGTWFAVCDGAICGGYPIV